MWTERRLAKEYGVSGKTIRRDAKLAEAVNLITANCGHDAKDRFFAPEGGLTCKDALRLAQRGPADQRAFIKDWKEGLRCKPWEEEDSEDTIRVPTQLDKLLAALMRDLGRERMR